MSVLKALSKGLTDKDLETLKKNNKDTESILDSIGPNTSVSKPPETNYLQAYRKAYRKMLGGSRG